jgi:hypothetical protein
MGVARPFGQLDRFLSTAVCARALELSGYRILAASRSILTLVFAEIADGLAPRLEIGLHISAGLQVMF